MPFSTNFLQPTKQLNVPISTSWNLFLIFMIDWVLKVEVQIKNNGIDYVELINDGLETSVINSVTYFDHKYFITTNSGVFYRNEGDFFSYK